MRMYLLVGTRSGVRTISHTQTAKMALPFILLQTVILLIFTFVDPNKRREIVETEGSEIIHRYVCDHDTPAFFSVMMIYEGGLILVGCVLAFKTRNLRSEFNEVSLFLVECCDLCILHGILFLLRFAIVKANHLSNVRYGCGCKHPSHCVQRRSDIPRPAASPTRRRNLLDDLLCMQCVCYSEVDSGAKP